MIRRFRRDRAGLGAVEFALIAPFMLLAILGSFQVFALARARMLTAAAARNLADLVSQQDGVTVAELADFRKAAKLSLLPLAGTAFKASIASVSYSGTVRKADWTDARCGAVAANATNATTAAASVTPTAGDSAIVVAATFTYASRLWGRPGQHAHALLAPLVAILLGLPLQLFNCALQTTVGSSTAIGSGCSLFGPSNATVNCSQSAGKTINYYWNDMGGPSDDRDYNDVVFNVTCPSSSGSGGTAAGSAVLTR